MGNQQVRLGNLYKVDVLGDTVYYDRQGFIYSTATGVLRKLKLIPHGGKTKKVYYRVKVLGRMWMVHHLICMGRINVF